MEYDRYSDEWSEVFETESSDRAFEEEVMLSGFGQAPVKSEGSAVSFDTANEAYTARYTHETIALAFAITEEAVEDNLRQVVTMPFKASELLQKVKTLTGVTV